MFSRRWTLATLKSVVQPYETVDPRRQPERRFQYVDISSIDNQLQKVTEPKEFFGRDAPSRARRVVKNGDILFATVRAYLKNIAVVPEDLDGELTSTGIVPLRPNNAIVPNYLFNWVRSDRFITFISKSQSGTLYPAVTEKQVLAAEIAIPPLAEQERIVAKLDSLISRTAYARNALDQIPALIEKYKVCLLEKAFSQGNISHATTDGEDLKRYGKILVGELVENIVAGKNLRCEERPPSLDERGVVKVSAVTWGKFDPFASKTLPPTFEPSEKSRIRNGDLLISRANTLELVGAVVVVEGCPENLYLSDKVLRLEMPEDDKRWLMWFLRSPKGRKEIEARASGNQMSMRNLSQKQLREIPLPWPPLKVRSEIIRRIDAAYAWLDRVSDECIAASKLLSELDSSILQAAFNGELVPQDPHEEPASTLIERIRAECEARQAELKSGRKLVAHSRIPTKKGAKMENLIEVLKATGDWVSTSEVAQALGISDGVTSDVVEEFYNNLRVHLLNGYIEVERRGEEDWLRLIPISEG